MQLQVHSSGGVDLDRRAIQNSQRCGADNPARSSQYCRSLGYFFREEVVGDDLEHNKELKRSWEIENGVVRRGPFTKIAVLI
jgi:hypothetical protein